MGLTNNLGLLGLIAIPIIIILYMLRPKNKPVQVPSLYLWKQMSDEIESASRIKKLKSSILMFLQILVAILLSLILAGLYMNSTSQVSNVLLVIDTSYTMGANDVGDSRLDEAKEIAKDYINQMPIGSSISLLVLEDVPKTMVRNEDNQGFVVNVIDQLEIVDGLCDIELAAETIETLRQEGQEVVYIGDRYFAGITNMRTLSNSKNYSIHDITYTKYLSEASITALTEIYNHDIKTGIIPISLYVDDQFFAAKQLEIEGESSGKVFFENIPIEARKLHVQIDGEDILERDNHAYAIVGVEQVQKAILVTQGNTFLEKVLTLHPNIELFLGDDPNGLYGYDLYIFDGLLPLDLPVDGNYLIFNPDEREVFKHLGYVENPIFTTNNHSITEHIENTEFSTKVTSVFEVEDSRDIIYNTEFGAGAFETVLDDNKAVVFGFDIHYTDLPLSIEFPIMMMNTLESLLTDRMTAEESLYVGDSMVVSVFPSTVKGDIISPSGEIFELDLNKREYIFSELNDVGIYTIRQERTYDTLVEEFSVNIPKVSLKSESIDEKDIGKTPISSKSLAMLLGIAALVLMLLEWTIYSYRRKIHEYSIR